MEVKIDRNTGEIYEEVSNEEFKGVCPTFYTWRFVGLCVHYTDRDSCTLRCRVHPAC